MCKKHSAIILQAPPVAYWTCPSCGTKIKNLNKQGEPTRKNIHIDHVALEHPIIHTHLKYVLDKLPKHHMVNALY